MRKSISAEKRLNMNKLLKLLVVAAVAFIIGKILKPFLTRFHNKKILKTN
jgi:hypothetical protein